MPVELVDELLPVDGLDPALGTLIEPLACVLRAQDRAGLRPGDSLLVVGAGVSGLLHVAAAHARAVEAVWVREPREDRRALAEAWGAEHHGNELVDVAIACTPRSDAIAAAAEALAPGGELLLYAPPAPGTALDIDGERVFSGELTITASYSADAGDMRAARDLIASGRVDLGGARHAPPRPRRHRPRARAPAQRRGAQGGRAAVRAAVLHGPGDLRVEDVPEPEGEVLVRVEAATACGTDVKMWRHGHPALDGYPARFGHETAGVRLDTGERVLVGDSVACGACAPCAAGRAQICRDPTWVLGGFAELIAAPAAALHAVPDGLPAAAAAMAEPLAAALHAVGARRGLRRAPACSAAGRSA